MLASAGMHEKAQERRCCPCTMSRLRGEHPGEGKGHERIGLRARVTPRTLGTDLASAQTPEVHSLAKSNFVASSASVLGYGGVLIGQSLRRLLPVGRCGSPSRARFGVFAAVLVAPGWSCSVASASGFTAAPRVWVLSALWVTLLRWWRSAQHGSLRRRTVSAVRSPVCREVTPARLRALGCAGASVPCCDREATRCVHASVCATLRSKHAALNGRVPLRWCRHVGRWTRQRSRARGADQVERHGRLVWGENLWRSKAHGWNQHETRLGGYERSKTSRGWENLKASHSRMR